VLLVAVAGAAVTDEAILGHCLCCTQYATVPVAVGVAAMAGAAVLAAASMLVAPSIPLSQ
jgi:hypothetical protein